MIHRAGTPQGEKPGTFTVHVFATCSYATDYLIPLSFDSDLDEESIEILGCNKFKTIVFISPLHNKVDSKINKRILLKKFLARIVG